MLLVMNLVLSVLGVVSCVHVETDAYTAKLIRSAVEPSREERATLIAIGADGKITSATETAQPLGDTLIEGAKVAPSESLQDLGDTFVKLEAIEHEVGMDVPISACVFQILEQCDDPADASSSPDCCEYTICRTAADKVYYVSNDKLVEQVPFGSLVSVILKPIAPPSSVTCKGMPWADGRAEYYAVQSASNPLASLQEAKVSKSGPQGDIYEASVLMLRCQYTDFGPSYASEEQLVTNLYGTPEDFPAGQFPGAPSDMLDFMSYGKFQLPRRLGKVLTVNMGSRWADVQNCPMFEIAGRAMELARQQHGVSPDSYAFREFFIPSPGASDGGCQWGGVGQLGCAHPSLLPNVGKCNAWYRITGPVVRAQQLGHNLGLAHTGAQRTSSFIYYSDFSWAATRAQMDFLKEEDGQVLEWGHTFNEAITLGSTALPLGQPDAEYVAIKIPCPNCIPVTKFQNDTGGFVWVEYRGDKGFSAMEDFKGTQRGQKDKVHVYLARQISNRIYGKGIESWARLGVQESFSPPRSGVTIHVCEIVGEFAKVAISTDQAAAVDMCRGSVYEGGRRLNSSCVDRRMTTGWRLVAQTSVASYDWDVRRIKLNDYQGVEIPLQQHDCQVIDSGSFDKHVASNVFTDSDDIWAGRKTISPFFFVGVDCTTALPLVGAVQITQPNDPFVAKVIEVQRRFAFGNWENVARKTNLTVGEIAIEVLQKQPILYKKVEKSCSTGETIEEYNGKTVDQCSDLCNGHPECHCFEFGVDYGGSGSTKPGHCRLKKESFNIPGTCDGQKSNTDLYEGGSCDTFQQRGVCSAVDKQVKDWMNTECCMTCAQAWNAR